MKKSEIESIVERIFNELTNKHQNTMKKERYILKQGSSEIGRASSITKLGKLIGCTKQHIYQKLDNGFFTYKKETYQIIDRLD